MQEKHFNRLRNGLILAVLVFEAGHLTWEHFNGGIITHHLFMREDLPGISNWWGLIILPLLVWCSAYLIKRRPAFRQEADTGSMTLQKQVISGFLGMLLVSTVQSIAFVNGYQHITMYLAAGVIVGALFLPLYRIECILGHVLGSVFVFGPAIPFVGVLMFAPVSLLSHKCVRPLFMRLINARKLPD